MAVFPSIIMSFCFLSLGFVGFVMLGDPDYPLPMGLLVLGGLGFLMWMCPAPFSEVDYDVINGECEFSNVNDEVLVVTCDSVGEVFTKEEEKYVLARRSDLKRVEIQEWHRKSLLGREFEEYHVEVKAAEDESSLDGQSLEVSP